MCFKAFCVSDAKDHHRDQAGHHVMMSYEIWQYERCFWCFRCAGYCLFEGFDHVLEPMFSSKGSFCPTPVRTKITDKFDFRNIVVGTATAQGWRSDNEDCHCVFLDLPSSHVDFFAIYDGHGGPFVARYVGQHLHNLFDSSFKTLEGSEPVEKTIQRTFLAVDELLLNEAGEDCGTCGSTACVVLLQHLPKRRVTCANAGDTRAVLCRGGQAVDLSADHRPNSDSERSRIHAAGSSVSEDRVDGMLAVSRAFGDFEFKQAKNMPPQSQAVTCFPDIVSLDLNPEDSFIIIACDGIWDCITSAQAVAFVKSKLQNEGDVVAAAEALIDMCMAETVPDDGIGTDNMSVTIVRL
jgi:protein phosphatase 2C family protein 2/3